MRVPLLLLLISIFTAPQLMAQEQGVALFAKGDTLYKRGNYESAMHWFSAASIAFKKSHDGKMALRSMDAIRLCYQNTDHFRDALLYADQTYRFNLDSLHNKFKFGDIEFTRQVRYKVTPKTIDYLENLTRVIRLWPSGRHSATSLNSMRRILYDTYKASCIEEFEKNDPLGSIDSKKSIRCLERLSATHWPLHPPLDSLERVRSAADTLRAVQYFQLSKGNPDSATTYLRKAAVLRFKTGTWSPTYVRTFLRGWIHRNPSKVLYDALGYYFETNYEFDSAFFFYDKGVGHYWIKNEVIDKKASAFAEGKMVKSPTLQKDTLQAHQFSERGSQFISMKSYDSAISCFEKSSWLFMKYNCWDRYLEETLRYLNIESDQKTGEYYNFTYRFDQAIRTARIIYPEESKIVSELYAGLANAYITNNEYQEGISFLNKALASNKEFADLKSANLYFRLAKLYATINDDEEAFQYYNKVLSILNTNPAANPSSIADVYEGLAQYYYRKNDLLKTNEYLDKSLTLQENPQKKKDRIASVNIAKGKNYLSQGKIDLSIKSFKQAADYYEIKGDVNSELKALNCLFECFVKKGSFGELRKTAKKSRAILMKNLTLPQGIQTLNLLAEYADTTDEKLENYNLAIGLNLLFGTEYNFIKEIHQSRLQDGYVDGQELLKSFWERAMVLKKHYDEKHDSASLLESVWSYQKCDTLISRMNESFTSQSAKLELSKYAVYLSEESIHVSLNAFAITGNNKFKEYAFHFMEKIKAGLLRDAIVEVNAEVNAGIPDSLLQRESRLKTKISNLQKQLAERRFRNASDTSVVNRIQSQLFTLNRQYESIITRFEIEFPNYFQLRHNESILSSQQIRNKLDKGQALVEYMLGSKSIYSAIITPSEAIILETPIDSTLIKDVTGLRNSIIFQSKENFKKLSSLVYNKVFKHVEEKLKGKGINELIIVPDDILGYVPFEVLLGDTVGADYAQLNYLVKKYKIAYSYSATLFFQVRETKQALPSYVAFAPVFKDINKANFLVKSCDRFYNGTSLENKPTRAFSRDGKYINPLPGTEEEVKRITKLASDKNLFAKYFLFKDAKEETIKSGELAKYKYIHFATHGIINDKVPELSGLLLSQDSTSREDGILYSGEIFSLKLNADLVVLSACETGLGTIVKGEGIMGLTRSWLYAGAKSVLVTLWKVADQSTADLMIDFYDDLLGGKTKSESLRAAKLQLISSQNYADPYYWAPFILIGK